MDLFKETFGEFIKNCLFWILVIVVIVLVITEHIYVRKLDVEYKKTFIEEVQKSE